MTSHLSFMALGTLRIEQPSYKHDILIGPERTLTLCSGTVWKTHWINTAFACKAVTILQC